MKREEIFEAIEKTRAEQDALWPRDERRKAMYSFTAPHILVLEEQLAKMRADWYSAKGEDVSKRLLNIATIAIRALEEVTPFGGDEKKA